MGQVVNLPHSRDTANCLLPSLLFPGSRHSFDRLEFGGQRIQAGVIGLAGDGVEEVGRDLEQGDQDEGAAAHLRVRKGQFGCAQGLTAVQEDIDIDQARSPADFVAASAQVFLDLFDRAEQFKGRQGRTAAHDGVDEPGLGGQAPGRRAVEGRPADGRFEETAAKQFVNGAAHLGDGVAEIGAKAEIGVGRLHGIRRRWCRAR